MHTNYIYLILSIIFIICGIMIIIYLVKNQERIKHVSLNKYEKLIESDHSKNTIEI